MPESSLTPKQEVLLTFLGLPAQGQAAGPMDPVRIMKGLFVFAQEIPKTDWVDKTALYSFVPYLYGPCSFEVYRDLDHLAACGYVRKTRREGCTWDLYASTQEGLSLAQEMRPKINLSAHRYMRAVKEFVTGLTFSELLRAIYHHYPAYAVNSIFKT